MSGGSNPSQDVLALAPGRVGFRAVSPGAILNRPVISVSTPPLGVETGTARLGQGLRRPEPPSGLPTASGKAVLGTREPPANSSLRRLGFPLARNDPTSNAVGASIAVPFLLKIGHLSPRNSPATPVNSKPRSGRQKRHNSVPQNRVARDKKAEIQTCGKTGPGAK